MRARRYTWSFTAARLRRLYTDLAAQPAPELVACSSRSGTSVTEVYDDGRARRARSGGSTSGWRRCRRALPVAAIDRGEGDERRWFVRLRGEDKDFTTVWLTLGQRTLRYETYVMPAPEENAAELYEHLLRRNERLVGAHFSIGVEDAVFLRGELPVGALDEAELDRAIGTLYATVEQCFQGCCASASPAASRR